MQSTIIDEIEITPEEVKSFFDNIPRYELPIFGTELEISQIVVKPEVSDDDKKKLLIDWNLLEMMLLLMVQVLPLRQFCILKTQVRDQWVENYTR